MAKSRHFELAVWHFSDREKNRVERKWCGEFVPDPAPGFYENVDYRRAPAEQPEKITINDVTINAPLRSAEEGQAVWRVSEVNGVLCLFNFSQHASSHVYGLKSGQLFATAADAEAAHRAVTLALGGEV